MSTKRGKAVAKVILLIAICSVGRAQSYTVSTIAGGGLPHTPVPAISVSVSAYGIATDSSGNTYFTSPALNSIFKVDTSGVLTIVAGNSRAGFSGDGGPATAAQLNLPYGLAIDSGHNLYVADSGNNRVRKITSGGTISTVAGAGSPGAAGEGGSATAALLNRPAVVALDSYGNLFVSDASRVRKVAPNGTITSLTMGTLGAEGLATDASGNLYLSSGEAIDKIDTSGNVTTFVTITNSYNCLGTIGPGRFPELQGITFDGSGNLYVTDFQAVIYKVTPNGTVTRIAGSGPCNLPGGDGGPALSAALGDPTAIAFDAAGNLLVAAGTVRKISTAGVISTIAGNGQVPFVGDGGPATQATLSQTFAVASDAAGNVFLSDILNNRVRRISAKDGTIQTIAGTGVSGDSGDGGPAVNAEIGQPQGVVVDSAGNVYISANHRIRRVSGDGTITTIAGTGTAGFSGDGGPAVAAQLSQPTGLALDSAGNLYFADQSGNRIREIAGGIISTFADISGQFTATGFGLGIAADAQGNVYVADPANNRIRKIAPGGAITTIAGDGQAVVRAGNGDGGAAVNAELNYPTDVAVDAAGNIFIADAGNNQIRKVTPDGIITTVAGNGLPGYFGDGNLAWNAEFNQPLSLALDATGNIYVADTVNNSVRQVAPSRVSSSAAVTNGFSNLRGPVAPGEIIVIYGAGLGPDPLVEGQPQNGKFGTQLAGVQVLFNGVPAPVLYAWTKQVAAVVPFEVAVGGSARIQVQYSSQTVFDQTLAVTDAVPGVATADATGGGQAVAINQDGTWNNPANPAKLGSAISLFWTGGGQMFPALTDGQVTTAAVLPAPGVPVVAMVGGPPASVEYAGIAPTYVSGLLQVNIRIPSNAKTGSAVPVTIDQGVAVCCIPGNGLFPSQVVTIAIAPN